MHEAEAMRDRANRWATKRSISTARPTTPTPVAVLDDPHEEEHGMLTLALSDASGGRITDDAATGIMENHDARPEALIARFGRAAAVHVPKLAIVIGGNGAGKPPSAGSTHTSCRSPSTTSTRSPRTSATGTTPGTSAKPEGS